MLLKDYIKINYINYIDIFLFYFKLFFMYLSYFIKNNYSFFHEKLFYNFIIEKLIFFNH